MSTLRPSAPRVSRLDAQSAYSTSNISKPVSLGTKGQRSANAKVLRNVIGIDLGTTYSVVGAYRNGGVKILANDQGNRTTPSVVAFTDNDRLIGETAINQIARNPENTVFDVKRLIGRNFDDESVQNDLRHWPFKVIKVKGNYPMIEVMHRNEKRTFFPEQISSMVLGKMQEIAADNLGAPVDGAVITVPAHFNDAQRQATKDAGMIAGLHVLRVINEPTAAAIAYGMEVNKSDKPINALIFDLGGGTFDVSVVQIENGVFQVRSTGGDTHLGGDDFDNRLVDWCVQDIKTKNGGVDISTNPRSLNRLRMQCERAKRTLSTTLETTIDIDGLFEGVDYSTTLTRARFNELNMHYFNSTMVATQRVIDDSHLSKKDINEVVLVGGSARIPKIREMLSELFDGKTLNQSVNPDEAVAIGAAMEAGVLANLADDMIFSDVTPLTLGIETAGGVFTPIIPRNTTFPARATQTFTTMKDNQRNVLIAVYEGERGLVADNHLLGNVRLDQIPLAKRGVPEIEVEYMMDADGILNVSGCVTLTGNKKEITITNTFRRRKSETDRLIAEAQEFAKQDAEMKKAKVEQVKMENATVYHAEVPVSVAGRSAALKKTAASPRSGPSSPSRARRALSQSRTGGSIAPSRTRSVALSRPRGSKAPSKASRSAHLSRATSRAGGSASPPKATMSPLSLQAPSSIQGTAAPSHIDISSRQVNVRSSVAPSQIRGSHSPSQAPPHTAGSVLQSELGRSASPSRTASYTPGSVSPSKVSRSPSPSRAPSHTAGSVLPLEFGRSASQSRTASYTPGSLSPSKVSRSPSPSRAPSYTQGPVSPSKVSRSPSPSPAPSYTQGPVSISKVSRSPSPSRAPSYTHGPVSISKVSRSPSPSRAPSHTAGSVLPLEFGCSVSPSRAPSRAPSYTPGSVSPLRIIRSPSPSRAPSASRGSISPFRSGISPSTSRALSYTPESGLLSQLDHSVSPSRAPSGTRGSISPSHGDFTPSASDSPSRAQGSMSPSHLDGSATPSGTPLRSPESVSPSTGTRLSPKSPTRRFASPSPSITRSHVSGSESPSSIRDPAILSSAPSSTPGSVCPSRVDGAAASHIPKARGLVGKSAATGSSSPTHLEVVSANKRGPTVGSSGTSMIPSRPGSSNSLRASNSGGFFSRAEKFVADLTRRSQNSKAARE